MLRARKLRRVTHAPLRELRRLEEDGCAQKSRAWREADRFRHGHRARRRAPLVDVEPEEPATQRGGAHGRHQPQRGPEGAHGQRQVDLREAGGEREEGVTGISEGAVLEREE